MNYRGIAKTSTDNDKEFLDF